MKLSRRLSPLIERYTARPLYPALSYATVRDYCDSADAFRALATHQGDLKDVQRPWAVKAIINCLRPGSRLLEIGSGEPLAASTLASLGYDVTVCDPFDGSGHGPVEYDAYRATYRNVRYIRSVFTPEVARPLARRFDCVFSVSVLEHVVGANLDSAFAATGIALRLGGYSIHALDHVLKGNGDAWHAGHMLAILALQNRLAGGPLSDAALAENLTALFDRAAADLDTFYLSPQGHNGWRGATAYDEFPFRKCISLQSVVRAA